MKSAKILILSLLSIASVGVESATPEMPDHNIVIFDLIKNKGQLSLANPQLIADSPGYDNQPSFSEDSQSVFFTRIEAGNADIWQWSKNDKKASKLISTPLSEYSPTQLPFEQDSISMVVVEKDGTQRLWKYNEKRGFSKIFESIEPVGYHVWSGKNIAMFVLGEPHQLQVTQLGQESANIVDSNIGRCLQKVPGKELVSYTVFEDKSQRLKLYNFDTGKSKIMGLLPGITQDYVWYDANTLISSNDGTIMSSDTDNAFKWKTLTNSSKFKLSSISRLALSKDKKKLAVVYIKP